MSFDSGISLLLRLKADNSQAKKQIKEVKDETDKLDKAGGNSRLTSFLTSLGKNLASLNFGSAETGVTSLTERVGGLGGSLSAVGGPAGLAAGAIIGGMTAALGATVALGVGLFNLTKQASDFIGEISDASQKTGLTVEAMSALKFGSEAFGSSFEEVTASVTKFNKLIGDAARGSKEAETKLTALGINPKKAANDLDAAFAQAIKRIYELPPGAQQANAAMDAFGKTGANLIPFINSFDGDTKKLIATAKELGVTLSDADAKAGDEFGDTLEILKAQTRGLTVQFAKELLPVFTGGMRDLQKWFSSNKESVKEWGKVTAEIVRGVIEAFKEVVQFIADHPTLFRIAAASATMGLSETAITATQNFQQLGKNAAQNQPASDESPFMPKESGDSYLDNQKEAQEQAKKDYAASNAEIKRLSDEEKAILESKIADLKRGHDKEIFNTADYIAQKKIFAAQSLKNEADAANAEIGATQKALAAQAITGQEAETKVKEQQSRIRLAKLKYNQELQNIDDEAQKERLARLQKNFADSESLEKQRDDNRIAEIRENQEKGATTYAAGEQEIYNIQFAALQRKRKNLEEEFAVVGDNLKEKQRIQQEDKKLKTDAETLTQQAHRNYESGLKKDLENEISLREHLNRLAEIRNNSRIAEIEDEANRKHISLVKAVEEKYDIGMLARANKRVQLSIEASKQEGTAREETLRHITELDAEGLAGFHQFERDRLEGIKETNRLETEGASRNRYGYPSGTRPRTVPNTPVTENNIRKPGAAEGAIDDIFGAYGDGAYDEFGNKVEAQNNRIGESFQRLGGMVKDSAGNMVGALGSAIEGYLLYGDSIGAALKKAAAAELAHIASVSAIKAIYQLAEGFAMLFINPAAAAGHFQSAALYGAVAIGAGIGAKALAGDSFKNQTSGKSISSGVGEQISNQKNSNEPRVINEPRAQPSDAAKTPIQVNLNLNTTNTQQPNGSWVADTVLQQMKDMHPLYDFHVRLAGDNG